MRTSILVSLFLTISAPMFVFAPNAYAQSATVTVNEEKRVEAVKGEDYKLYIEAMGGVNSDALFAEYKKERAAYTANPTTVPTPVTPVTTTATNEELKIQSFKDYDYNMYVRATGGVSNDSVHIKFNKERNAYLGTTTPTTTGAPTTEVKTQKPSHTFRRNSVNKPNYRTKPGRMIIKVIHVYE
jgi:hypothetical protein